MELLNPNRFDYFGICWWCQENVADSAEHKWKRTDYKLLFEHGEHERGFLTEDGTQGRLIQGANSRLLKFGKTLCAQCNGSRSQESDYAYSVWQSNLAENYTQVIENQYLEFVDDPLDTERCLIARYYAKHIGCVIVDSGGRVPDELIEFMNGTRRSLSCVFSEFAIRRELLAIPTTRPLILGRTAVLVNLDKNNAIQSIKSSLLFGAIEFIWDVYLGEGVPQIGNGILNSTEVNFRDVEGSLFDHRFWMTPEPTD